LKQIKLIKKGDSNNTTNNNSNNPPTVLITSTNTNINNTSILSSTATVQQNHNLTLNFVNKEPFNEDLEPEECIILEQKELEWRTIVFDKFKLIINEIKELLANPKKNVNLSSLFFNTKNY
jgi:hypothetical protein